MKSLILLIIIVNFSNKMQAQIVSQKTLTSSFIEAYDNDSLFLNKKMDSTFMVQIKTALLFYPELKNTKITFRIKKRRTPLTARPTIWAVFQKPQNRHYLITISSQSLDKYEPILLKNLSFNAQVGVLGHELSHISDYHQKKGLYFIKLVAMRLSKKAIDKFEYETDRRCIEHGLGYQLLAWSREVRKKLNIEQWRGVNNMGDNGRERYMNPSTILSFIRY
jgi:hypothetical protein